MHISLFQLLFMALTGLLFAVAFLLGLFRMRGIARATDAAGLPHDISIGNPARAAIAAATLSAIALLVWRSLSESTTAIVIPVSNPFDAFLVLAILLSFTLIYFRWTRHLRSLSFFLLPMIVIILLLGIALALIHQKSPAGRQDFGSIWNTIHLITIIASTLCFALACVGGIVYLAADRRLRRRGTDSPRPWISLPPLASIEKFNRWLVYTGFPLLTIATIAGILVFEQQRAAMPETAPNIARIPKIAFGILCWLDYAILIHVPLNPRFRGRRAAWLAIIGFVLFLAAFAAANWS